MKGWSNIKINFKGGIISPGELCNILDLASRSAVRHVSFGLRQQLLMKVRQEKLEAMMHDLRLAGCCFEVNHDEHPNIVSSYPAAEIFINHSWLSEGVYKDILDQIDYQPRL